ncbi:MAG: hypothetical protein JWL61_3437, partial [Gemmatimonadetes bacterium]|nr:hypothetical protein [Gemmatimonadota bacterium]
MRDRELQVQERVERPVRADGERDARLHEGAQRLIVAARASPKRARMRSAPSVKCV